MVGASNQFAHAAARAVAEIPSKSYNPLFLYGGVGLGKTHLMHAIGHYIQARNRHLNLLYISTDRFINEMINAIRFDRLPAFRQKYRTIDVLLVDDIQFIAGKDRTQEEFFHIFNALHDSQKQIVISSDCPPRQIPTIEERLHSRFEWGLIADIQPPDIETKVAILRKKAESERVETPGERRPLHRQQGPYQHPGARRQPDPPHRLSRASRAATSTSPSPRRSCRDLLRTEDKPVTIEMIQKFVADHYNVKLTELKAKNNSKAVAVPRQIAMYLTKTLTGASLPEIGKGFGGKHHSTVIHSVRKIDGPAQARSRIRQAHQQLCPGVSMMLSRLFHRRMRAERPWIRPANLGFVHSATPIPAYRSTHSSTAQVSSAVGVTIRFWHFPQHHSLPNSEYRL